MLTGVNIEATVRLARAAQGAGDTRRAVSRDLDDVKALCAFESEGITGAIAGRAIYEGTLDFKEAIKAARGNAPG